MSSRLTKKRNVTKSQVKVSNAKHHLTKKHINRKSQTRKTNLYKVRKGDKAKKTIQKGGLVCKQPKRGFFKKLLFGKKNDTENRMKECFKTELLKMLNARKENLLNGRRLKLENKNNKTEQENVELKNIPTILNNKDILYFHPYDDLICRLYFGVKIKPRTYAAPKFETDDYEYITELLGISNTEKNVKTKSREHIFNGISKRYTFYEWLADYYNFIFKDATYEDNKLILEKFMKIKFSNEDQTSYREVNSKDIKNEVTKQKQKDLSEYIKKISSDYIKPTSAGIARGTIQRTAKKGKVMLQPPTLHVLPLKTNLVTHDIKDITHIWFTDWPDHGVPKDETKVINGKEVLIEGMKLFHSFITYVYDDMKKNGGNTVIHCSAGIGRTGVVYMVLFLLNMGYIPKLYNLTNDKIDKIDDKNKLNYKELFEAVTEARSYRFGLVQTNDQYDFIYNYFVNKLEPKVHTINPTFANLTKNCNRDLTKKPKNVRYGNFLPCSEHVVELPLTTPTYIHASKMNPLQFGNTVVPIITAECPYKNNENFYTMLDSYDIKRIIMVTGLVENEREKCDNYFNFEGDNMVYYNNDSIKLTNPEKKEWGIIHTLSFYEQYQQKLLALPISEDVEL